MSGDGARADAPGAHGPRVVLVGPPGSGKSTVGRLLARRLGLGFRDTDADVERTCGTTIADLFVEHGEAHFRRLERAAVAAALAEHTGVLALGGGAVLDPATRADLAAHPVVFLDVGVSDAAKRVGLSTARPLLLGNVRGQLRQQLQARRPLYLEVATWTVATDDRSPEEVAEEVAGQLRSGVPG